MKMMSRLSSVVKRRPLITFFVLTYAISWAFLPIEAVRFLPSGPLIAALIVIPLTQGWVGLRVLGLRMIRWRVRWYWYVVALEGVMNFIPNTIASGHGYSKSIPQ